mgnify:CR=1 FL=1|tara:strand:- start:1094 stop:2155 length:1062 start_codon:yes stop_codon:yes gene_type:complete
MNLSIYKNLKILVTGSTGFKGSWLCYWLHEIGANVVGISLKPEKDMVLFKSLDLKNKITQYYENINNYKKLNLIIKKEKPKIIFHLAAQSIISESIKNPLETIQTNIIGSANIMSSFYANSTNALVYCTSDKCYKNNEWIWGYRENDILGGNDPYSASKACSEIIFKSFNKTYLTKKTAYKNFGSVRSGNVIGGGDFKTDRIIPDIIRSIIFKKQLIIKNPKSIRPWLHVLDTLSGYLLLGTFLLSRKKNFKYPHWNFGPNIEKFFSVKYLLNKVEKYWNCKLNVKFANKNKIYESKFLLLNNEKAKLELGWKPKLDIEKALDLTNEWYYTYHTNKKSITNLTSSQIEYYTKL